MAEHVVDHTEGVDRDGGQDDTTRGVVEKVGEQPCRLAKVRQVGQRVGGGRALQVRQQATPFQGGGEFGADRLQQPQVAQVEAAHRAEPVLGSQDADQPVASHQRRGHALRVASSSSSGE